jgi:hypothetical protein
MADTRAPDDCSLGRFIDFVMGFCKGVEERWDVEVNERKGLLPGRPAMPLYRRDGHQRGIDYSGMDNTSRRVGRTAAGAALPVSFNP